MTAHIQDRIPLFCFDENLAVFTDGSLGTGFRLTGFDISCASPDATNEFAQKIESFLVGLPEGMRVQVFYRLTDSARGVIEEHKRCMGTDDPRYAPIARARYEFLEEKMQDGLMFVPEIYLFLRSGPLAFKKRGLFEKRKAFDGFPPEQLKVHREKFLILRGQAASALGSAGLQPTALTAKECFGLSFTYYNKERAEEIGAPSMRDPLEALAPSLAGQLAMTDLSVHQDHLELGTYKFRAVSLNLLPEGETFASMVDRLTKLPFHFWISQNIKTLDQKKEIERLELSRRIAHSMVAGSNNVSDLESESKYGHIEELLRELMNGSERLVSMSLTVIFWGETFEELERKSEEILRSFRSMNQAEGLSESFALEDAFFRSAPLVCEGFRHSKVKSSNCAHLMPLYACWTGNKRPVVLLTNREGTPFAIDPFAKELPNWNGLVFGGSGAGKSFTISQLMLQFCNQVTGPGVPRPKIVWIDNGASSEKLIEVMEGEFIDLNLSSGICLNMFDLDGQGGNNATATPSSSKIKLILGCLELILKDEDKPGLPKREKALLEECIFETYRRSEGKTPTLSVLRAVLAAHSVVEMRKHADILFSWTGETAYGRMLDGQTNVRLEKDLVTIEIKGLDNHRELKDIFLLLFTSYIKEEAARDLSRPYLLIIDEAHRLFLTPSGKDFAIESYRVFRKYNAGILCVSQNYRDFLADRELADALMPNTTNVFVLRQRKIDWEDFKNTFDFNDAQVDAVKSLEIVKGKFSEFFLMQDENQGVVRLEPEPLSYWICTTDGNEKARIAALREKEPMRPLVEILEKLAKGETYSEDEKVAA